jgi:general secretion pathway protein D
MNTKRKESFADCMSATAQAAALVLLCLGLASCATRESSEDAAPAAASIGSADSDGDPAALVTPTPDVTTTGLGAGVPAAAVVPDPITREGRNIQIGRFVEDVPEVEVQGDDTISLNLEQEDLRRVFEQLGDALQLNMVIDPGIDSVVSVRTTDDNPLTFDDIWPLMRLLAREAGVTIEQAGNVWVFTDDDEVVPTELTLPGFMGATESSEVLQVTPLRYISRETAGEILAPLLDDDGSIISLGARNLLGISGPPGMLTRVNALLDVIDDDPFQNQGIKLYQLQFTQAVEVSEELAAILELIEGEAGVFQVLGLARINAVLVIGSPERGFNEVDRWISVLDTESQEQVEQLFFYSVKNLDALALADTLISVFGEQEEEDLNLVAGADNADAGLAAAPGAAVVADEDTNSLLIRSTPRDYRQLLTIISRLDTLPKQVMINAVIGQATLSESTAYGVDWVRVSNNLSSGPARLSSSFLPAGILDDNGIATQGSGLVLTRSFANGSAVIDATLNAIALENEVTLLARPTLMATNNQQGEIIVGQEVPVDGGSTVAGNGVVTANITYRDVGIVLTITPHINDDGYINLEIFQSLSSVEDSAGGVSDNPIFTNQEITTTAVVANESVIALGGLIQEETLDENNGIPGLRRIPGLRVLFSYTENRSVRRELFVILRPQIINGDENVSAAQQELKERFEVLKAIIEEVWS